MDTNPMEYLIPIISILAIVLGIIGLIYVIRKLNQSEPIVLSSNNSKQCTSFNEESQCSNYGTYEGKTSSYSIDSRVQLNKDESNESIDQQNTSYTDWTSNFVQKIQKFKSHFKPKIRKNESIDLKRFSRMSSSQSLPSYTSLNSLATILSNEIIPAHTNKPTMILNYSLKLNQVNKSLHINIVSLENVRMPISLLQSNIDLNVYIRIEILEPNREKNTLNSKKLCAKTRLIRNKLNPIYDETFEFNNLNELFDDLLNQTEAIGLFRLVFNVCNSNLFGRDQIIGLCVHKFSKDDLDLADNKNSLVLDLDNSLFRIYSKKIDLVDSKLSDVNLGQLQLTMCYNNKSKVIQIHILKAFDLHLPSYFLNSDKKPNSYIKIYMIYRGQRVDKKQTKIEMDSKDPIFDQIVEFNILNLLQLSQPMDNASYETETDSESVISQRISSRIQFILLVMDWDKVEKNDVIGKIELNTQNHMQHLINNHTSKIDYIERRTSQNWFDIFSQPNQPILCTFQIKNY